MDIAFYDHMKRTSSKDRKWLQVLTLSLLSFTVFTIAILLSAVSVKSEETIEDTIRVLPSLYLSGNFPCSKCHDALPVNKKMRKLTIYHGDITLEHAEKDRWCLDCHSGEKLRLPNGELVAYDKSVRLCGQCHGSVYADWKEGIHGRRTGSWSGEKLYRPCVHCHNPHKPQFRAIKPERAPLRPSEIKLQLDTVQ